MPKYVWCLAHISFHNAFNICSFRHKAYWFQNTRVPHDRLTIKLQEITRSDGRNEIIFAYRALGCSMNNVQKY
jgi:hypothetical protein